MSTSIRQKAFGQNFLVDRGVISKIIESIEHSLEQFPVEQLIEIGPGHGALTIPWIEKHNDIPLTIIEKDNLIADEWREKNLTGVSLLNADAAGVDYTEFLRGKPVGIFSNLPYSVGTKIFSALAEHPDRIRFMVLMFQKEVAERILLKPGSVGSLGVWSQNHWDIQKLLLVPPSAFKPKPKIDSLVIKCTPRTEPKIKQSALSAAHKKLWQELLKLSFSHRRKMLRPIFNGHPIWKAALADSQVPETLRAEVLSWAQWNALYSAGCVRSGLR